MTISYHWLCDYLPLSHSNIDPEKLSRILTSIGLEVESMEPYESIRGGLHGLVTGEVLECEKHPNADKLTLTKVSVGNGEPLQIVCGAPNVAAGQKVVVAPPGTTIYPSGGEPITLKAAKIRGVESQGMICAEDEIGLGKDHSGILVLDPAIAPGTPASDIFKPYSDRIYEIGLTPNRMDAMSHLGVARDVCAYLSHHEKKSVRIRSPFTTNIKGGGNQIPIQVSIENTRACQRYSGISITGVSIGPAPQWLQQKLLAIGQRPINNIVDITNFILHETGQPLHAFDADAVKGNRVIVKNLPSGTRFTTLDEKERTLDAGDLMICDGNGEPMCIAGVFGGRHSGVTSTTRNIFLESAWFNPVDIRKTSFRHGLRTDAALRFEKNTDISNTLDVLKRAAAMICELTGGTLASEPVDVYPNPPAKKQITLKYHYLKKLSGKNYHPDTVKKILQSLGFETMREGIDDILVAAPLSKPDILLPADVVEEIMRIDGLDNIEIPVSITISPSSETSGYKEIWKEKISAHLVGHGFHEILTNSITNAAYFEEAGLAGSVKLLNNLSAEHNIMRPSMLETGLEAIAYNLNRRNTDLRFFEFGKTYRSKTTGTYYEKEQLCIYVTGQVRENSWKEKGKPGDLFYLKGVLENLLRLTGMDENDWKNGESRKLEPCLQLQSGKGILAEAGQVSRKELKVFDIRQEVFYASIDWEMLLDSIENRPIRAVSLPKQLPVYRDLALVVESGLPYGEVEKSVKKLRLGKLQEVKLFDIFESEKLGSGKKSLAVSFTFLDPEKTLTDKEIDGMMQKIMTSLEKDLGAEIRK